MPISSVRTNKNFNIDLEKKKQFEHLELAKGMRVGG